MHLPLPLSLSQTHTHHRNSNQIHTQKIHFLLSFPNPKHPIELKCHRRRRTKKKKKKKMASLIMNMEQMPKMSLLMLLFCIFLSFPNNNNNITTITTNPSSSSSFPLDSFPNYPLLLSVKNKDFHADHGVGDDDIGDSSFDSETLQYDYYRSSCPQAERIVRSTIRHLYHSTPSLVPAIIRLLFHDCFVQGCDASVLLDDDDYIDSEKESPPNGSLKGFEVIDTIKSKLEEACPGVVSCSDILALAARDSVTLAGGLFYPLNTGRRDGSNSFADIATYELPSPYADLSQILASFNAKGFNEKEMVTLLGAHSIGEIHCRFFKNRLYNFTRTNEPDPSIESEFLDLLRSRCSDTKKSSKSGSGYISVEEPGITMDLEQPQSEFGTSYYRSLLEGRGILYADQQLMEGEGTRNWIKAYALDPALFQRDFALAMMKLSDLHVLTPPMGQIRLNCSKVL